MSFPEAIRAVFRDYFAVLGRARRAHFWWWALFAALAGLLVYGIATATSGITTQASRGVATYLLATVRKPLIYVAIAFLAVPTITAMVRRLHDVGRSGRWLFVPALSTLVAWYLRNRGEHLFDRATELADEEGTEIAAGQYWFAAYSDAQTFTAKLHALPLSIQVLLAVAVISALAALVLLALPTRPGQNAFDAPAPLRSADRSSAYAMITPFFVLIAVFSLYVFALGLKMSFTNEQGTNEGEWVGLLNYKAILYADLNSKGLPEDFLQAIKITFLYTLGGLVTQVPVAFVLAYVLNTIPFFRIRAVLRAAFFVPCLINIVTISLLFRMFFLKDGIINHVLGSLNRILPFDLPTGTEWLMHSQWALPLMIVVSFWQWTGFHMVYFLAQLQTVDPTLYEAAKMDGITPAGQLRHITLPLMRPAITFVAVTSAIGGLQTFELVFILFPNANFGPGGVAKTLVAFIYDEGFGQQQMLGLASALGWLTFLIIAAVSALQIRFLGLGKHGEA
jgi:ABC-type sugar transport system permease subunit